MQISKTLGAIALVFCAFFGLNAQPAEKLYDVTVYPSDGVWNVKPGQKVKFNVEFTRCKVPTGNAELRYEISEDMMPALKSGTVKLKDGKATIDAGTMKTPGFLRCRVFAKEGGRDYEGRATVGFSPEKLKPVTKQPADFKEFWNKTIADARKTPLDPQMTLMPELCTPKVNVYHVSFGNNGWGSRFYGILTVPTAHGKYPAILKVPGAGVRAYKGDIGHTEKGCIILEVGIHGIPVNLPGDVYHNLYQGALKGYHSFNMDDRDRYYYKRVYTGCVRAIDFIEQLPDFNGHLGIFGGSQGGALAIVISGLDPRIEALVSHYPALSDMAGYSQNRAGGWPHTLKDAKYRTPENLNTLSYYDVASFAPEVKAKGMYTFGYNDMVCPPTTSFSVYNSVTAPKELLVTETTEHYAYPEQSSAVWRWILNELGVGK